MLRYAIALVVVLILVDCASLGLLSEYTGWHTVFAEIIMTALIGVAVIRWMPSRLKEAMDRDACPWPSDERVTKDAGKGYLMELAGVLLILPGPVTDLAGVLLLGFLARRLVGAQPNRRE